MGFFKRLFSDPDVQKYIKSWETARIEDDEFELVIDGQIDNDEFAKRFDDLLDESMPEDPDKGVIDEVDEDDGFKEELDEIWEKDLDEFCSEPDDIASEFERSIKECVCDLDELLKHGCKCGAMDAERDNK